MSDECYCGYIKFQWKKSESHVVWTDKFYANLRDFKSVRETDNFVYVQVGHDAIRDNNHARDIIRMVRETGGWITRLDFYIDIAEHFDIETYYTYMLEQWKAKKGRERIGMPIFWTSPEGDTCYIGKRSSDRMLRVYDKRNEILKRKGVDIDFDLTRYECEIKRKAVRRYETLFMAGNERAILQDMAARWALPQICDNPEKMLPLESGRGPRDPLAFVRRYRNILSEAYSDSPAEFMCIIKDER